MAETNVTCLQDIEEIAIKSLPRNALDYYRSGANHMSTLKENKTAFQKYKIMPRMMIDVSIRNLKTKVLGQTISMPIGISPTAMQKMAHPDGECASAKAAEEAGIVFILSTISTSSIEEVAAAAPKALKWFQLYIYKDRKVTANLVRRAEKAGFSAIVLTVDAPYFGRRLADIKNKFKLPPHLKMANFVGLGDAETQVNRSEKGGEKSGSGINDYVTSLFDQALTWKDISWLKSITNLPIIVKGVLHPEDAVIAMKYGVQGIMVSNHGARQLDGVEATIDALPAIVEVVKKINPNVEVYLDGGVREGTDVLKALALGAKLVCIGRPVLWGLTLNGQKGVKLTLDMLKKELDLAMALSGCTDVNDIDRNLLKINCKSNL